MRRKICKIIKMAFLNMKMMTIFLKQLELEFQVIPE